MLKAKATGILRILPPLRRLWTGLVTGVVRWERRRRWWWRRCWSSDWLGWVLWASGSAQAQEGEPPAVSNLRCIAETDRVAFLWDEPEWSGGDTASYDYELSLPGGRTEGSRVKNRPRCCTVRGATRRGRKPGSASRRTTRPPTVVRCPARRRR